jgi:5-methylcytosine-specific restriction enzyme A
MPYRARKPCCWPGCPALTSERYCLVHTRVAHRQHDRTRGPASQRGYGGAWAKLRLLVLHEEPLCCVCGAPATDVDHIIALARGGDNSRGNLQALCKSCHSVKTLRDDGGWGKKAVR